MLTLTPSIYFVDAHITDFGVMFEACTLIGMEQKIKQYVWLEQKSSAVRLNFPIRYVPTSGGFRGGDGGDASPPTSLKVTILAEKSASVSNNSAPFRDASPPLT